MKGSNQLLLRFAAMAITTAITAAAPASAGLELIFEDGFESSDSCAWGPGTETCPGFTIVTPPTLVAPGQEATRCYYVHTGNAEAVGIHRMTSSMEAVAVNVALYTTHDSNGDPVDVQPPGTLADCAADGGSSFSRRVFMGDDDQEELVFPEDDGTGTPLGLEILAAQPAVLVMQLLNASGDPVTTSVRFSAYALPPAASYTPTATFTTFNGDINVPPTTLGHPETKACPVPEDVKFWWFSTHTHGHAVEARIEKGTSPIVVTTDWESPSVQTFGPPEFYAFGAAETLEYTCTYNNPDNAPILTGDSLATDEHCMALAYYFPAPKPRFCYNNLLLP